RPRSSASSARRRRRSRRRARPSRSARANTSSRTSTPRASTGPSPAGSSLGMQPQRTSRAPRGSLAEAYRQGRASAFFPLCFAQREDRLRAVRDAAARPIAAEVLAGLRRQNEGLAPSPARERHLEALGRGAVAVVTGQQVGLFLGPLFTIYKAATAIRFARLLTEESGTPAVPIFWLQTEDHDLPEIARFWLPDPQ